MFYMAWQYQKVSNLNPRLNGSEKIDDFINIVQHYDVVIPNRRAVSLLELNSDAVLRICVCFCSIAVYY